MKLKGVNPLEQHVEKIVLAGVSAVFLAVLAMQFLVEPNKVKVGTEQPVPPGKAFLSVEAKARALQSVMTQQDLSGKLPQAPDYDLVNQLRNERNNPLVAPRSFALGPKMMVEGSDARAIATAAEKISPVSVPAPAHIAVAAFRATLDPTEPLNTPELKPFIPAEQPLDTRAVSVACTFDGTALKAALGAIPAGPGVKPIPTSWWRDSMEILAVRLERQTQKADGGWSEATEVPTPPGRFTMADRLKDVHAAQDLMDAVVEARSAADEIQRPQFYRTIAPAQGWSPPVEGAELGEAMLKSPEIDLHVNRISSFNKQLESVTKTHDEVAAAPVKAPVGRDGGGGGGGGGKGAGGGGQIAPSPQTGPSMTQQEKDSRLRQLDRRIKDIQAQIDKESEALKALGRDPTGKPLGAEPAVVQPGTPAPGVKPLLEDPAIKLWSHDMTVEPGKTYRYRVKVGLNNPAFARTSALLPDQHDMAASALAFSQPSPWSAPVQVLPDEFYFLTSATEADALGPPRATAEVFKYFYGYYRKASVSLEPGDSVSVNIRLPDPVKLPIYDLSAVPAPGAPAPAQPAAPGPGGKGGQPGRDGGRGAAPTGAAPGQPEKVAVTLPANAKPYPKQTISASVNAMLLDVARVITGGEGGPRSEALMRDASGRVVVAVPDDQRHSPIYQMALASAKEGENQGQPTAPAIDPNKDPNKPAPPRNRPGDRPPPPPPPGGGGGGAGGG